MYEVRDKATARLDLGTCRTDFWPIITELTNNFYVYCL